jgi:hypothetical protein
VRSLSFPYRVEVDDIRQDFDIGSVEGDALAICYRGGDGEQVSRSMSQQDCP